MHASAVFKSLYQWLYLLLKYGDIYGHVENLFIDTDI